MQLQERIMYPEHPTVLSTLESLAETCVDARRFSHAMKYYTQLFDRSQSLEPVNYLKQAETLQKIASIYGKLEDLKMQTKKLEMALRFVRSEISENLIEEREILEEKIQGELRLLRLRAKDDK